MERQALVIGGKSIVTDDAMLVRNPATGEVAGEASVADLALLNGSVEAARAAFPGWRGLSDEDRCALLRKCADTIEAHAEELAHLLTSEQGKPLNGLGSRFELTLVPGTLRYTADLPAPIETIQDDAEGHVILHREPLGVVASITPWNWPLMLAANHFVPALRMGNTVVVKPSPLAPLSTLRMIQILAEVLPPGVLNAIACPDALAPALTGHPDVNKVAFTGSTATGAKVMESGASTIKSVTLELGGNDAAIVLPDCDPRAIAEGLFWGAFNNSGQTCAAIKRLYVHDDIYGPVCEALAGYAAGVAMGEPMDEGSLLGPLQNPAQRDKVARLVDEAKAAGARVLCGGERPQHAGNYYPVTLVADADDTMALVREEQFGPALPILRFSDAEDALARANASDMGLGGSVWSADHDKARALARRMECGTAWINKHAALRVDTPFGGRKMSGIGTQQGADSLKQFSALQVLFD